MLWLKAFHLISMVTWFAGIFYLPRLFVYHTLEPPPQDLERFKVMEQRLCYQIMTPSAVLTLFFGSWLLWDYAWSVYKHSGWLHAKLLLIFLLVIYHAYCIYLVEQFKQDNNRHSTTYYRWFNEIPVFILVGTVLLAVLKPF